MGKREFGKKEFEEMSPVAAEQILKLARKNADTFHNQWCNKGFSEEDIKNNINKTFHFLDQLKGHANYIEKYARHNKVKKLKKETEKMIKLFDDTSLDLKPYKVPLRGDQLISHFGDLYDRLKSLLYACEEYLIQEA